MGPMRTKNKNEFQWRESYYFLVPVFLSTFDQHQFAYKANRSTADAIATVHHTAASHLSSTLTLSTGSPQGCVLSPFLYSLYTHDCVPAHHSNVIVKFSDDTTVMGLISNGDETAYREEVQRLTAWCSANNLLLNASKTKEMIFDWSGTRGDLTPFQIDGSA